MLLIWSRSRLELLPVIFVKFVTELCPLIDIRILFPLNILRTNGWNFTKFYICISIGNWSKMGLLPVIFYKFLTELWPLIDVFTA